MRLRLAGMSIIQVRIHVFCFISTPFFSAQPWVAYREAVFEPWVCLDLCLANKKTFVFKITKKVMLNGRKLGNVFDTTFFVISCTNAL